MRDEEELEGLNVIARYARCSPTKIRGWINAGHLPAYQRGPRTVTPDGIDRRPIIVLRGDLDSLLTLEPYHPAA